MTKRITALAILLAFILTMGGCYDASYVVKSGDVTILPGVYLIIQLNAYTNLAEKMGVGSDFDSLSIKEQMKQLSPIDQRDAYTWVKDLTNQDLTTYIATEKLFAEKGFSLSDEELAEIKNDSRQLYEQNKAYFESNGIGLESYKAWITNQYKNKYLFKSIYYENGTNPVSLEEQKAAFAADYAKLKVIQIPIYKYDAEYGAYVDLDEDTIKELEGKAAEIAGVVSFVLSEDAAYMTGEVLSVDGGASIVNTVRPSGGAGAWDAGAVDDALYSKEWDR